MNDLIERYIYAVTRRLPRSKQEDVAKELRGLVEDMLLERCGEAMPEEKDVRIVLTELGSPQELYEKYDESSGKCLIGQPYYTTYLFVLKIVALAVAVGLTISAGIVCLLEHRGVFDGLLSWLSMLYNGLLSAFAIVTLLFPIRATRVNISTLSLKYVGSKRSQLTLTTTIGICRKSTSGSAASK